MITTLILIRHGETAWNRDRRIQGHLDVALSEKGLAQAKSLARRFEKADGDLESADRFLSRRHHDIQLVSSDLARAVQTATPIAQALGLEFKCDACWRERHYGAFEGHAYDEIEARFPEWFARWQAHDPEFDFGHGESRVSFQARIEAALSGHLASAHGKTIVVVAHGGVLDCVYRAVHGIDLAASRQWPLLNASLNVFEFEAPAGTGSVTLSAGRMLRWGDTAHLNDADGLAALQRVSTP